MRVIESNRKPTAFIIVIIIITFTNAISAPPGFEVGS